MTLRSETFLQSVSFALALSVACRLVAFGRGLVLVRTLDPADLGTWALLANAVQVLAFVLALGIPSGIMRYAERSSRAGLLGTFLTRTICRTMFATFLFCAVGLLCWGPVGQLLFGESATFELVALTMMAVLATGAFSLLQGSLQGLRLFRFNSIVELGQNGGFLLLLLPLLFCWRKDVSSAAVAHLLITIIVTFVGYIWIHRAVRQPVVEPPPPKPGGGQQLAFGTLLVYSLGTWSAGSLQAAWRGLDRYMLLHLGGLQTDEVLDQIGQYFIASKLGQPLSAFAGVLAVVLVPHAARLWEEGDRRQAAELICRMARLTVVLMTLGAAALLYLKQPFLLLLAGYLPPHASQVLAPALITIIAISFQYVSGSYLLCGEKAWSITGVWAMTLGSNILFNLLLIPHWQLMGAAVATMLSASTAGLMLLAVSRYHGLKTDSRLWLSALLPLLLLCPQWSLPSVIGCLMVLVGCTNRIFDAQDRARADRWIREKIQTCVPGKARHSTDQSVAG